MKTIEEEVSNSIEIARASFDESTTILEYERAIEEFEALVQSGLIQKRGNQSLSISDAHLVPAVRINEREYILNEA